MKTHISKQLFIIIVLPFLLQSCTKNQPELQNLGTLKKAIIKYHESGNYEKDISDITSKAKIKFDKVTLRRMSTVVFDVDETSLSNFGFNKDIDFGYVKSYWDAWIDSASAPPIPPVLDLYKFLVQKGFRIIFITGRKDYQYKSTYKNLINSGYTKFDTLICRSNEIYNTSALEYKSGERRKLTKKGYEIEGTVGDQWSDLNGDYHGLQVKLPNYQYYIK